MSGKSNPQGIKKNLQWIFRNLSDSLYTNFYAKIEYLSIFVYLARVISSPLILRQSVIFGHDFFTTMIINWIIIKCIIAKILSVCVTDPLFSSIPMYEVSSPFRKLACCARRFMPLWRNTPAYLARTTPAGSPNCCFACHPSVRSVSSAWSTCSFSNSSARSEQSKISSRRCWSHHQILRSRRCAASWGTPICERKNQEEKDDERENRSPHSSRVSHSRC